MWRPRGGNCDEAKEGGGGGSSERRGSGGVPGACGAEARDEGAAEAHEEEVGVKVDHALVVVVRLHAAAELRATRRRAS